MPMKVSNELILENLKQIQATLQLRSGTALDPALPEPAAGPCPHGFRECEQHGGAEGASANAPEGFSTGNAPIVTAALSIFTG